MDDRRRPTALAAVALLLLCPALAAGQAPAPTFDQLAEALTPGQRVIVTDVDGRTAKGRVSEVTPSGLTVRVFEGFVEQPRRFERDAVRTVRRTDSVLNGVLIGVAAGFAANEVWVRAQCGPPGSDDECTAIARVIGWVTIVPGSGAIGALVDKLIGETVLYQRPAAKATLRLTPDLGPKRTALRVLVRF